MIKKVIVEKDKMGIIGKEKVEKYQTLDGKIFDTYEKASTYQKELNKKELLKIIPYRRVNEVISFDDSRTIGWYYLKNEEEARLLDIEYTHVLKFPGWALLFKELNKEYHDYDVRAINKDDLILELQTFINEIPDDIK